MVIDAERADEIKKVFKGVYDLREEASNLTGSSNDLLKGLAQRIAGDDDWRPVLESLNLSYKVRIKEIEGKPDTFGDAIQILEAIK